ncbi:hypothetical protein IAT38_008438 [Cryptococcus sp. DSM 104549]
MEPATNDSVPEGGPYDCVVLGCGVLGLSIAVELIQTGLKVAVVGRDIPGDWNSADWASPWGGAVWQSYNDTEEEGRWEKCTFERLAGLAREHPDVCQRVPFNYYWTLEVLGEVWARKWYRDLVFGFRYFTPAEVPSPYTQGVTFESYIISPPNYLQHLSSLLSSKGVPILRHTLPSLSAAYTLPEFGPVDLVINATGLGAGSLPGLEDPQVFPSRGETVLVRAPDVRAVYVDDDPQPEPSDELIEVVPLPGSGGLVSLGRSFRTRETSTVPDSEVAERVIKACYRVCPLLDNKGGKGSWRDVEVVKHAVGLWPFRSDRARVELEEREVEGRDGKVGVVHAYGTGSEGYQSSVGIAVDVAELVMDWKEKVLG